MSMIFETTMTLDSKRVWIRQPYQSDQASKSLLVGMEKPWQMVLAAFWGSPPLAPLLIGPTGCGKTFLAQALAESLGLPLYMMQGFENGGAEELAVSLQPSEEGNGRFECLLSSLATAMAKGGLCLVDEIGKYPGKSLALLAPALDHRRYLDLEVIRGGRIHAHPLFRFIATTNTEDLEGLPDFIRSRLFPVIRIGKPDTKTLEAIVKNHFPAHQAAVSDLLGAFWGLWDSDTDDGLPSPRDTLQIFSLAFKLACAESAHAGGWSIEDPQAFLDPPANAFVATPAGDHLERALQQFREGLSC